MKTNSTTEDKFFEIYIRRLLEEYGYFPDDPTIPITDVYVQLKEREILKNPKELKFDSERLLEMRQKEGREKTPDHVQPDLESSYGRVVELSEALRKQAFILISEPGGGKTTTLRSINIEFAIQYLHFLRDNEKRNVNISWDESKLKPFRNYNPRELIDKPGIPVLISLSGIREDKDVESLVFDSIFELVKNGPEDVKGLFDTRGFIRNILKNRHVILLFDALDEASHEVRQEILNGIGEFIKSHDKARVVISMRIAIFRELNVPEELRTTYELLPLTEPDDRKKFIKQWIERLSAEHPTAVFSIASSDEKADEIFRTIEEKGGALRRSLENPLLLKIAVEAAFLGGIEYLEKARSRANLYEFHIDRLFYRAMERLRIIRVTGTTWENGTLEFAYELNNLHVKIKDLLPELKESAKESLKTLSIHMFQNGGRIKKDVANTLDVITKLNNLLVTFQRESGAIPHSKVEFLRKDMGIIGELGEEIYFLHKAFLEYFFAEWLRDRWQENPKLVWKHLKECLHSSDMREVILLFASLIEEHELERFIRKVMKARSEFEYIYHRDLLLSVLIVDETGYNGILKSKIISTTFHLLEDKDSSVQEATIQALSNLRISDEKIISKIADKLDDEDPSVQRATIFALSNLKVSDEKIISKIVDKLEDEDSLVRKAAIYAFSNLRVSDRKIISKIADKLEDEDSLVRKAAIEALSNLGISDEKIISKIADKLEDENPDVRRAAIEALSNLRSAPRLLKSAISKYAGHEWKLRLDKTLPDSRAGNFLRKILKVKRPNYYGLSQLLQKFTILRCSGSIEDFINMWKLKKLIKQRCPECEAFLKSVIRKMFDFKGINLLLGVLSLALIYTDPVSKKFPSLPKPLTVVTSYVAGFLVISFAINALCLLFRCKIRCPKVDKATETNT